MSNIQNFFQQPLWQLLLLFLIVVLFVIVLQLVSQLRKLRAVFNNLLQDSEGGNFEQVLTKLFSRIDQLGFNINQLGNLQQECRERLLQSIQKTALLRFNPFEDMGGDQSFAIALLDEQDNGLIISSLHARDGTRVYAKPIISGKSTINLADEEKRALREALAK